jgi:oligopeptidase B
VIELPAPDAPPVAPVRPFVHEVHGHRRTDSYSWLRDKHAPESVAYLEAERTWYEVATAHLAASATALNDEMVSRIAPSGESVRWRQGGREYFTREVPTGEYEQFCRVGADGAVEILLDVNALAGPAGFVELGVREVSPDGRLLAYSVDTDGEEVYELRFRDLTTGLDLADHVRHTYYTGAWSADSTTFFYTVNDDLYRPYQVWRHVVGSVGGDVCVFDEPDGHFDVTVTATRSGAWLLIESASRNSSEVHVVPAADPEAAPRLLDPRERHVEYSVDHAPGRDGGHWVIVTNRDATEFRVMIAPVAAPNRQAWTEVIAERPDERIHGVDVFASHVVVDLVRDAHQSLRILPLDQLLAGDAGAGHLVAAGFPGGLIRLAHNYEADATAAMVEVEGYLQPRRWENVDFGSGQRTVVKETVVPNVDFSRYDVTRRAVPARDGTTIPVTVVRATSTPLDGTAPCLLYGYGAYESAWWPGFEPSLLSALDRGVIYVHAHIRGGGEGGRRWWLQGCMAHKMTTFTDFVDVADALADTVVDGSRIVSRGLSAGGLLQGAVFSLRPDRWAGVVAEVPFVDVVTTMFDAAIPLTVGEWEEWGDPRNAEQYQWLLAYSPYDQVPGVERPGAPPRPPLLTTGALHDPRVSVHEPAKWVAKLRATARPGDGPVLFRVETGDGGHTGPQGRFAAQEYEAEVYAWILEQLGRS